MLIEPTYQLPSAMRMLGFARALRKQLEEDGYEKLCFEERVAMLIDTEHADREARKLTRRLQNSLGC